MEKLQINTGGQPVCLDDLMLLQDAPTSVIAAIVSALTGGREAVLLNSVKQTTDSEGGTLEVAAGSVVVDGNIHAWPTTTINLSSDGTPYVCLKEEDADFRTFEDGQTRPTRRKLSAFISSKAEGLRSWLLQDLLTLREAMGVADGTASEWQMLAVTFSNGYGGYLRVRSVNTGDAQFELRVSRSNDGIVRLPVVCTVPSYPGLMPGLRTPYFTDVDGETYALCLRLGMSLYCYTDEYLEGGQLNVIIPKDISHTWLLSDMVEYNR